MVSKVSDTLKRQIAKMSTGGGHFLCEKFNSILYVQIKSYTCPFYHKDFNEW